MKLLNVVVLIVLCMQFKAIYCLPTSLGVEDVKKTSKLWEDSAAQLLKNGIHRRDRRQLDLDLSVEHDEKEDETELALEAIASLWTSPSGKTKIDGSARVLHRSTSLDSGSDWRLGLRVEFAA